MITITTDIGTRFPVPENDGNSWGFTWHIENGKAYVVCYSMPDGECLAGEYPPCNFTNESWYDSDNVQIDRAFCCSHPEMLESLANTLNDLGYHVSNQEVQSLEAENADLREKLAQQDAAISKWLDGKVGV